MESILLLAVCVGVTDGLDNSVGRLPPMGWNSWGSFKSGVTSELLAEMADTFVSTGLKDAGYEYINSDDYWMMPDYDTKGGLIPRPTFPDMKNLSKFIHNRGLKFGLYVSSSKVACSGFAGSLFHEEAIAAQMADWEVDYLKNDNCGQYGIGLSKYTAMRDALNRTGRPIFYSTEPFVAEPYTDIYGVCNCFRTVMDLTPRWEAVSGHADTNNEWAHFAGPGGWNDPDVMEVGNFGTFDENVAHFSIWALMKAPLLLGNDPRNMPANIHAIVTNKEVIAINQDALGVQGCLVAAHYSPEQLATVGPEPADLNDRNRLRASLIMSKATGVQVRRRGESQRKSNRVDDGSVELSTCVPGVVAGQSFSLFEDGSIRSASGSCLTASNNAIQLSTCDSPISDAQSWVAQFGNTTVTPLVSKASGACLTQSVLNQPGLSLMHCNNSQDLDDCVGRPCNDYNTSQLWYFDAPLGSKLVQATYSNSKIVHSWGGNKDEQNSTLCVGDAAYTYHQPDPPVVFPAKVDGRPVAHRQAWAGPLSGGDLVLALWNRGESVDSVNITHAELNITGTWHARDLWAGKDLGVVSDPIVATGLGPHALQMLRLSRQ